MHFRGPVNYKDKMTVIETAPLSQLFLIFLKIFLTVEIFESIGF